MMLWKVEGVVLPEKIIVGVIFMRVVAVISVVIVVQQLKQTYMTNQRGDVAKMQNQTTLGQKKLIISFSKINEAGRLYF